MRLALIEAQRALEMLAAGLRALLLEVDRDEEPVAKIRRADDFAERAVVRVAARPRVDDAAAVLDERADDGFDGRGAALGNRRDGPRRAQADERQRFARRRDRPRRHRARLRRHAAQSDCTDSSRREQQEIAAWSRPYAKDTAPDELLVDRRVVDERLVNGASDVYAIRPAARWLPQRIDERRDGVAHRLIVVETAVRRRTRRRRRAVPHPAGAAQLPHVARSTASSRAPARDASPCRASASPRAPRTTRATR